MVTKLWLEGKIAAAYQDRKRFSKIVSLILAQAEEHSGKPAQAVHLVNNLVQILCIEGMDPFDGIEESQHTKDLFSEYSEDFKALSELCGAVEDQVVCAQA